LDKKAFYIFPRFCQGKTWPNRWGTILSKTLNQSILLAPFSVKVNRPAILSATQKDHSVIFYNTEFCVSLGRIPSLNVFIQKVPHCLACKSERRDVASRQRGISSSGILAFKNLPTLL
jgi:hypothetical protein